MAETVETTDKKYPELLKEALKNLTVSLRPKKYIIRVTGMKIFLKIVWQLWAHVV